MCQYIQKFSGEGFLDKGSNLNPFFGGEGEGLKAKKTKTDSGTYIMASNLFSQSFDEVPFEKGF